MQTRYRWFRIQLPTRTRDLAELVSKRPFDSIVGYGFARVLDGISNASYRFLWRSRVVVTNLDAEGLPTYEQIDSVSFNDFSFIEIKNITFLRIENPGRNVSDLLNALETLAGMGFTAKPITFNKDHPRTLFSSVDASKLVGFKIIDAVLSDDLVARMDFASKEGMHIEDIPLLHDLKYKFEHASFEIVIGGLKGQISFFSNGTVKISGKITPILVNLVEEDLHQFA